MLMMALMLAMVTISFTACSDKDEVDEPQLPVEEETSAIELTLIGGKMYDGSDLLSSRPTYENLVIILEPNDVYDDIIEGKYTEKYGKTVDGTGYFTLDESGSRATLTITADTYLTADWGNKFYVTENEKDHTITLSPKGWEKQTFIFSYKNI